jgi:hypothetical protein
MKTVVFEEENSFLPHFFEVFSDSARKAGGNTQVLAEALRRGKEGLPKKTGF